MNYKDAINLGSRTLKSNNIKSYNLDSELLLAKALNLTREEILINLQTQINQKKLLDFRKLINRRKLNEPIAYILNSKEFWKYKFYVNYNVLIPRPETEMIVEESLKNINFDKSIKLLDIGTGSGCIIISILNDRPNCYGSAIDICEKALKVAKYNAKMHHLTNKINFINMDIDKFLNCKYDFIISNPPYIKKFDLKRLESNVRLYEPAVALEAGTDGFSGIKKIIIKSSKLLKKNGQLIFEIGEKQVEYSKYLLKKNGFYINKICNDFYSKPRVIRSTKRA